MSPLEIVHDIIKISTAIYQQAALAEGNRKKLNTLTNLIKIAVSTIDGLSTIPDNKQFILALHEFHNRIKHTNQKIGKIAQMKFFGRFCLARDNSNSIEECKQQIFDIIPLMNLGINAQVLMNQAQPLMDKQRRQQDEEADKADFIKEKETNLRESHQATRLLEHELNQMIHTQLGVFSNRLNEQFSPTPSPALPLPEEFMASLDDIVFDQKLNESEFGSIYQGSWQTEKVTIKCFDHLSNEKERTLITREAQIMCRLDHPSIAQFHGACLDPLRISLLTDYMEGGDLQTALPSLSLTERLEMAKDLAHGLVYLHEKGITLGNIHPLHIGIDHHKKAKWSDFGLVKIRAVGIGTLVGVNDATPWQAPESWNDRSALTPMCDTYSFGWLLWSLCIGKMPFANHSSRQAMAFIHQGKRETIPVNIPEDWKLLIEKCWSADVSKRPTASQIIEVIRSFDTKDFTGEKDYVHGQKAELAGNMLEARQAYQLSTEKGYYKAFTSLALFHLEGLGGLAVDEVKAQKLLENGAECGHARAAENLAKMSVRRNDKEKAIFWYERALLLDPNNAKYKEKLTRLQRQ